MMVSQRSPAPQTPIPRLPLLGVLLLLCVPSFAGATTPATSAARTSLPMEEQRPLPPEQPPGNRDSRACAGARCFPIPVTVPIPGGTAQLGDLDGTGTAYERPLRNVTFKPFAIGRFEVTFEEWDACHQAGACSHRPSDQGWGRGRRPVINVTWHDAQAYVAWLSEVTQQRYRLPSEAEWEYVARAGTRTRYSWGDGSEWVCGSANVFDLMGRRHKRQWHWNVSCSDGHATTAPVGRYPPNAWGVYDMHGNVWEWVEDCWHPDYTGAPTTANAWIENGNCRKRVNRGGGWGNHPRSMRAATRDADPPDARSDAMGFRVVLDLEPVVGSPPATAAPKPTP